jgi:hypothetical protein
VCHSARKISPAPHAIPAPFPRHSHAPFIRIPPAIPAIPAIPAFRHSFRIPYSPGIPAFRHSRAIPARTRQTMA